MDENSDCAQISTLEFLDFVKTAYQVHDSLEGILTAHGMNDAVDWLKLKQNKLINNETNSNNNEPIKGKLNEILSEGLLDSVLPYMVPANYQTQSKKNDKSQNSSSTSLTSTNSTTKRRNSDTITPSIRTTINKNNNDNNKNDTEIEIHVCDEVKNMKKDFICNKNLLIEKMGYFAEVTTGQRLEDMDISVHCDIGIFEWLMKWIKRDQLLNDDWPELTIQCVIPILVSASFLKIDQLLNDCLLYCHEHMNDILKQTTTINLNCLNDKILQQLSQLYTNQEIEQLKDRKDRIQSKLFIKLIQSLNEIEPETIRGHYWSLCYLYRCGKCQQLINPLIGGQIPCVPACMQLQCDGSIINLHVRDPAWNINDYILKLYKNLKTWRKVYWHLWGDAHFLYCSLCKRYFCVREFNWCRYHPDLPQYFTLDTQKTPLPIGRYPCCGERAYRYQLLQQFNGCQFREHTISIRDYRDNAILTMLEQYRGLIIEEPPQLMFPERLTRLVAKDASTHDNNNSNGDKKLISNEIFWWDGFQIVPPRPKFGLLPTFTHRNHQQNQQIDEHDDDDAADDSLNNTNSTESATESSSTTTNSSNSSSSSSSSEEIESNPKPIRKKKLKRKIIKSNGRLWQSNLSARSNQDGQRAHEENIMKEMVNFLQRRTTMNLTNDTMMVPKNRIKNVTPIGGVWVRLETDWKESHNIPKAVKSATKRSK